MPTGQTDRHTDGRQTVTLRFSLDAPSVTKWTNSFRSVINSSAKKVISVPTRNVTRKYRHFCEKTT